MEERPLVVLGASGYVGGAVMAMAARLGVAALPASGRLRAGELSRLCGAVGARGVVNCAGMAGDPNVSGIERDAMARRRCAAANAGQPAEVALGCAEAGVRLGHVSSACVFDGAKPDGGGWGEGDAPNFTGTRARHSHYSACKAAGELALGCAMRGGVYCVDPGADHLVFRIRQPYDGRRGPRNWLHKLTGYGALAVEAGHATQIMRAARLIIELMLAEAPGIYHLVHPDRISAREVGAIALDLGAEGLFRWARTTTLAEIEAADGCPRANPVLRVGHRHVAAMMGPVRHAVREVLMEWKKSPCIVGKRR